MMSDNWSFGLLTDMGTVIAIKTIYDVHLSHDGELWIDVELSETEPYSNIEASNLFLSPTTRTTASVSVRHIIAAFELADT